MANKRFNTQITNLKQPMTGQGRKPLPMGLPPAPKMAMPERHPNWGGLPGKSGPDRANGCPEEKIYAYAQGIRGGTESADEDDATSSSSGGDGKTARDPMKKKHT